jgi:hypothetical protein
LSSKCTRQSSTSRMSQIWLEARQANRIVLKSCLVQMTHKNPLFKSGNIQLIFTLKKKVATFVYLFILICIFNQFSPALISYSSWIWVHNYIKLLIFIWCNVNGIKAILNSKFWGSL